MLPLPMNKRGVATVASYKKPASEIQALHLTGVHVILGGHCRYQKNNAVDGNSSEFSDDDVISPGPGPA